MRPGRVGTMLVALVAGTTVLCACAGPPTGPPPTSATAGFASELLFGQTATWPDGLRVQVLAPEPVAPAGTVALPVHVSAPPGAPVDPARQIRLAVAVNGATAPAAGTPATPGWGGASLAPAASAVYRFGFTAPTGRPAWKVTVTAGTPSRTVTFLPDI